MPDPNYDATESEPERRLLHCLRKFVPEADIRAQAWSGRYRLDFLTTDGTGWEVDGRQYHDAERDACRDREILARDARVERIVRMPAALMVYFPHATLAACAEFAPCLDRAREYVEPVSRWLGDAARMLERWDEFYEYGEDDLIAETFREGETYGYEGGWYVGCPYAFLPDGHPMVVQYGDEPLYRWRGEVKLMRAERPRLTGVREMPR